MAENLKNTIQIDGTEYNINAVTSDIAKRLNKSLTVKKSGNLDFTFNGSASGEIDYVPTTGGSYNGAVYQNKPTSIPAANEFITSAQINNRVVDLNGAPICVWDTSLNSDLNKSLYSLIDDSDKLYKFTTITGTESDFYLLQGILCGLKSEFTYELIDTANAALGWKTKELVNTVPRVAIIPNTYKGTYNGAVYDNPVREVGTSTFKGNTQITSLILPDSIEAINNNAFQGCTNLRSLIIPNSVKSQSGINKATIAEGWFDGCTSLKNVVLGTGLTEIGSSLFQNCINLTSVVIPAKVTSIGLNAFSGCTNLKTIYYTGTSEQWSKISLAAGNEILNSDSVSKVYNYSAETTPVVGTPIDLHEISEGPFIYICKDEESATSPMPNKVFLKVPESNEIVEIAKGATCLSSTYATASYTYENLAEIIARINKRFEAIGGNEFKINQTDLTSKVPTIEDVNALVPDVEVKEYFDPASIPTIQEITEALAKIYDGSSKNAVAENGYSKSLAKIAAYTDNLKKLREDLDELIAEVTYELEQNPNNPVFAATSRLDVLERDLDPIFKARVNKIDYYDEIEWE